jgi:hypothetical protein
LCAGEKTICTYNCENTPGFIMFVYFVYPSIAYSENHSFIYFFTIAVTAMRYVILYIAYSENYLIFTFSTIVKTATRYIIPVKFYPEASSL